MLKLHECDDIKIILHYVSLCQHNIWPHSLCNINVIYKSYVTLHQGNHVRLCYIRVICITLVTSKEYVALSIVSVIYNTAR